MHNLMMLIYPHFKFTLFSFAQFGLMFIYSRNFDRTTCSASFPKLNVLFIRLIMMTATVSVFFAFVHLINTSHSFIQILNSKSDSNYIWIWNFSVRFHNFHVHCSFPKWKRINFFHLNMIFILWISSVLLGVNCLLKKKSLRASSTIHIHTMCIYLLIILRKYHARYVWVCVCWKTAWDLLNIGI